MFWMSHMGKLKEIWCASGVYIHIYNELIVFVVRCNIYFFKIAYKLKNETQDFMCINETDI
jgi:hypothetical protein